MGWLRLAVTFGLLLAPASAAGHAPGAPHPVHGIQRKVCHAGVIEGWPGGRELGHVRRYTRVHFYSLLDGYALVTESHPRLVRGYLLRTALCPIDDHHRAVAERDRRMPPPDHVHGAISLAHAEWLRVCAATTWLRDVPLNRPRRLLLQGDAMRVVARSHSGWVGGYAFGHADAHGWIPQSAVCGGLSSAPPDEREVADGAATLLAPSAVIPCAIRNSGRRAIVVGARGTPPGAAFLPALSGGPTLFGEPRLAGRGWDLAGLGPLTCGRGYTLTYAGIGRGLTSVTVAFAVAPAMPATAHAADACTAPPGKAFAHSLHPPVDHRYHARPAISGDGSRIAYTVSRGGRRLRLVLDGRSRVVTPPPGTYLAEPALSDDGRVLAAQAVGPGRREIVTIAGGRTRVIGVSGANPSVDADGGEVAFVGPAGVVVASGGSARAVVSGGFRPAVSADGRFVVAEVPGPTGWQIERVDVRSGAVVLVSAALGGGPAHGDSLAASIDADGGAVAFQSTANDLTSGLGRTLRNVFVRRISAGRTVLISSNRCGGRSDGYSRYPSISGDGREVAFDSHARNLVADDTGGEGDVYVRSVGGGPTRLLSRRPDGTPSALTSFSPAISGDGRSVAFASYSADLTTRPPPSGPGIRVYVSSLARGRTRYLGQAGAETAAVGRTGHLGQARAAASAVGRTAGIAAVGPTSSSPSVLGPFGVRVLIPRLSGSCSTGLRIDTAIQLTARRSPARSARCGS